MIGYLKGLASLRNVAILAGVLFTVYTAHIWLKNQKIDRLELENLGYKLVISEFDESQKTNLKTIADQKAAFQQCALGKKINEANSKAELTRQQGRIADINKKYDELRKKLPNKGCLYSVRIDDALLEQLYKD